MESSKQLSEQEDGAYDSLEKGLGLLGANSWPHASSATAVGEFEVLLTPNFEGRKWGASEKS